MENTQIKEGQVVRAYAFPPNSKNSHLRIRAVYPNGDVWASNMNMPFQGTISKIFSKEEFTKLTSIR